MELKEGEERELPKKTSISFKASLSGYQDDEYTEKDEDFSKLAEKVGKMFYRKGRRSSKKQRGKDQGRQSYIKENAKKESYDGHMEL